MAKVVPHRPHRRALLLCACAAGAIAYALTLGAANGSSQAPLSPVSVWVSMRHPGRPVAKRFLGLSFELSSLGQLASLASHGDLVALLRSIGPGVLRFGGISADTRVAWVDGETPRPAWASSTLDAGELQQLRALAVRSGWRVLLTLNLAHLDPQAAARETAAAHEALGPWLAGVEVGNEPDSYAHHSLREEPWTPSRYAGEVVAYREAIRALAPGVPLAGPDASGSASFIKWAPALARDVHTSLLTGHHYALGCDQEPPPSIERLLSFRVQHLENVSLERFMGVAKSQRIPFRLDETNSVSCGGVAGISNTFASALWAAGYIAKVMSAGASGMNLHGNLARCDGYSPLCGESPANLLRGELAPRPVWYALLLARSLIGERPLSTRVLAPQQPNVSVAAFRARNRDLQFVVVDRDSAGAAPAQLSLRVGRRYRAGTVLALSAPSLESTGAVTLGGRAVGPDGSWRAPAHPVAIPVSEGELNVEIPPASAALVTVIRAHSAGRGR